MKAISVTVLHRSDGKDVHKTIVSPWYDETDAVETYRAFYDLFDMMKRERVGCFPVLDVRFESFDKTKKEVQ